MDTTRLLILIILVSFLLCVSLSLGYVGYLRKERSWAAMGQLFLSFLVLVFITASLHLAITSNLLVTLIYYLVVIFLFILVRKKNIDLSAKRKKNSMKSMDYPFSYVKKREKFTTHGLNSIG